MTFTGLLLNDMEGYYAPGQNFDPDFLRKLETCFNKYDDNILAESQNNAWKGLMDYWENNGKETYDGKRDVWDILNPGRDGRWQKYTRREPGVFGNKGMVVHEPCNYVSNVAFYHATVELCEHDFLTFNTY